MKSNTLLVISSYPPQGQTHHKAIVGVASYTKNTLINLKKAFDKQEKHTEITVLAEKMSFWSKRSEAIESQRSYQSPPAGGSFQDDNNQYNDSGITVKRIWKRGSLFVFPKLLIEILSRHKRTKNILIELELMMFGNLLNLFFLPFFILLLRLLNKRVTVVCHQVILDIREMSGHLTTYTNSPKTWILNLCIRTFYTFLSLLSSQIVVFDTILQERLLTLNKNAKVIVIPHGIEHFSHVPTRQQARERLHIPEKTKVILLFGFIAWYKGTDWIVHHLKNIQTYSHTPIQLIIAGGRNTNHAKNSSYQQFASTVESKCQELGAIVTGFVPEEDIPLYFQAADLALFPYRTLMSASGPFSLACSFHTPFLLSEKLSPVLKTPDFHELITQQKIAQEALFFPLDESADAMIAERLLDEHFLDKLKTIAEELAKIRAWDKIGDQYAQIF